MKKHNNFTGIFLFLIMILLLGMAISCSGTSDDSGMYAGIDGETLYRQALELEGKAYYFSACDYYKKARLAFLSEKNDEKAAICKWKALDMQKITDCYSISAENLPEAMKAYNSSFTNEDLKLWLAEGRLECLIIEGSPWYYENCFSNLSYYYPDVFARDEKLQASVNGFTWMILNYLNSTRSGGMKISNPRRFEASRRFCIRRNLLPVIGTLRIWIPYPINSDAQKEIETVKISPAEFHKEGPNTDSDIGSVYLEVPLEQLKNDLEVEVIVRFTHHEKSFHIDPDKVGEYDVNSELYRKYTGPSFNTAITDEIRQKAFQIVGDETNPYIKAKLINEYICKNIKYGLIPLSANEAMNLPVSVYVHESKRGDCGAQGVYFSALCRAVGVPARATGGF